MMIIVSFKKWLFYGCRGRLIVMPSFAVRLNWMSVSVLVSISTSYGTPLADAGYRISISETDTDIQ